MLAGAVLVLRPRAGSEPVVEVLPAPASHAEGPAPATSGASGGFPAPAWHAQAPTRATFEASIEPASDAPLQELFVRAGLARAKQLLESSSGSVRARMTRVLDRGETYRSELELSFERRADDVFVELGVERDVTEPFAYKARLEGLQIVEATLVSDAGEQSIGFAGDVPIALGDMLVPDVLALTEAIRNDAVETVGVLAALNSDPLLVLRAELAEEGEVAADPSAPDDHRAVRALLYVDKTRFVPQAVRVFDRNDRLVRVYEGFTFREADSLLALSGLRVASLPNGSHTTFQLDEIELGED